MLSFLPLTSALLSFPIHSTSMVMKEFTRRDVIVGPTTAFQIFSFQPDMTERIPDGPPFLFAVSQDDNGTAKRDVVMSFTNLSCPRASQGAYSLEFNFVPSSGYDYDGEGQMNMFKLPSELPAAPTYNNIVPITGSLIGTFQLPTGPDAKIPEVIFINSLVCEPTINLRFGLTEYSSKGGLIVYLNGDSMNLRERSGEK